MFVAHFTLIINDLLDTGVVFIFKFKIIHLKSI